MDIEISFQCTFILTKFTTKTKILYSDIHAVAGGVHLDLPESGLQHQNIDKILIHEDFNHHLLHNDICLLKVR